MKLDDERESRNLEDRRGQGGGGGGGGGMGGGARIGGLGLVAVVVLSLIFGVDPGVVLSTLEGGGAPAPQSQTAPSQAARTPPAEDAAARFVSRVLASTEDVWTAEFATQQRRYEAPRLVLFSGSAASGCGTAQSAMGPFYCPNDRRVYLDLAFFRDLAQRMGAPGDFAQAYVIAHEVGHHVQNLLGLLGGGRDNAASVRTELQADCLAGFWAHRADQMRRILEAGDIEEGLAAAAAVGDDRLQQQARGHVVPESFTHGSSAQRIRALKTGLAGTNSGVCLGRG
ncbi:neutral zinc metallopeptidase [Sediminicoccus sp. KRV36]|uniref:KPN_02809 family neutral zinc metallopeptidase n=1 Tax=Sediminicoccus sp. KRV36 TaxID=3133721 RepID=UPI0020104892|nr:neutral zinc metallopeptidase [Sediminicoccus rosea]UPY35415.1 neutral zinc metallopeptidase [Sediminicoccus rosea]